MTNRYYKGALLLISYLSFSAFCFSQQFTIYNQSNSGLTSNTVRCVAIDTSNVVWVGTDNGLCRFDGISWTSFTPSNSPLSDYYIRCLTVDDQNRIWIGTLGSGIFIYDGSSWQTINTSNSGISSNGIREIDFDQDGNLWVASAYGLNYFDGSSWTMWDYNAGFYTNNISSVAFGPNNEKHIGTLNGGLHILDSLNTITYYTHSNSGLPDNTAYKVEFDSSGRLWMATPSAGLLVHLSGDSWQWFSQANLLFPTNSTNYVSIDGANKYISTYDKGLIIFDEVNTIEYNVSNSAMPENYLHCVEKDKNGILWVGTDNSGLVRLDVSLSAAETMNNSFARVFPSLVPVDFPFIRISSSFPVTGFSFYDSSGRLLIQKNTYPDEVISLAGFPAGLYFVSLSGENLKAVKKVVIQ